MEAAERETPAHVNLDDLGSKRPSVQSLLRWASANFNLKSHMQALRADGVFCRQRLLHKFKVSRESKGNPNPDIRYACFPEPCQWGNAQPTPGSP